MDRPRRPRITVGKTLGEVIAGRSLKRDTRQGVEHYEPGQHEARIDSDGDAWLTYVDNGGHLVLVICHRLKAGWQPQAIVRSGTQVSTGIQDPELLQFKLSDKMREALAKAERAVDLAKVADVLDEQATESDVEHAKKLMGEE